MTSYGDSSRAKERRRELRYPVHAETRYRVHCGGTTKTGFGETVNISSHGILFRSTEPLPLGADIEVDVGWPGSKSLRLSVVGRTIRGDGTSTAVTILEGSFLAMNSPDLISSAL
jgi:hypothetical protein